MSEIVSGDHPELLLSSVSILQPCNTKYAAVSISETKHYKASVGNKSGWCKKARQERQPSPTCGRPMQDFAVEKCA